MASGAYVLSTSEQPQSHSFEFSSKQYSWISDSNSGSYPNGSITFDLASLSNSGRYISWA